MVSAQDVQRLLEDIDALRKSAMASGTAGDLTGIIGRDVDRALAELPKDSQGKFTTEAWETLAEPARAQFYDRLVQLKAALVQATDSDGPTDKRSIMYKNYASNEWIIGLTLLGIIGTVAVLWFVYAYWPSATATSAAGASSGPPEASVLAMVILMGALGGSIHLTSSLGKFVGNRQLLRSWIIYYLLMPVEGASLAAIIYLLLRVGVLTPPTSGGSSTANLNLVGMYAFAGLTGLFSKQAIDMLADVFATIFKKVRAKDALDESDSGGGKARGQS